MPENMSRAQTLEGLRHKEAIPQTTTLDFRIHNVNPRDWVMIMSQRDQPLTPQWEGPFQVLLSTDSAVQSAEGDGLISTELKAQWKNAKNGQ